MTASQMTFELCLVVWIGHTVNSNKICQWLIKLNKCVGSLVLSQYRCEHIVIVSRDKISDVKLYYNAVDDDEDVSTKHVYTWVELELNSFL